jgi:hypothetical protein
MLTLLLLLGVQPCSAGLVAFAFYAGLVVLMGWWP